MIEKVIAVEQARKFLPPEKEMNLSIVMARWPTPEDLVDGVQELSQKDVTVDNLLSLIRNWPVAEYPNLLEEAKKDPSIKWDTSETYFIRLGIMPQIYERMQLFLYYRITG